MAGDAEIHESRIEASIAEEWHQVPIDTGALYSLAARWLLLTAGWSDDELDARPEVELQGFYSAGDVAQPIVGRLVEVNLRVRPVGNLEPELLFPDSTVVVVRGLTEPLLLGQRDFLERVHFAQRNQPPSDVLELRQVLREPT